MVDMSQITEAERAESRRKWEVLIACRAAAEAVADDAPDWPEECGWYRGDGEPESAP